MQEYFVLPARLIRDFVSDLIGRGHVTRFIREDESVAINVKHQHTDHISIWPHKWKFNSLSLFLEIIPIFAAKGELK